MSDPVRNLRFVLREITSAAETVLWTLDSGAPLDLSCLRIAILKGRNELDGLANAGKPTPATDPIDDITAVDVLGQIVTLFAAKAGNGGIPPALLCQSEERRAATRQNGNDELLRVRDLERYLRKVRTVGENGEPPNSRAFFFEG